MDASTTVALSTFGTVFNAGLAQIVPSLVATIQPIWVELVVVGVVLGVIGGVLALVVPKRGFKIGRKVKL